ncbi:Signal recognition particle receptor FtsY [Chlamydiales bacterium SCGC AG-110-P3]|nr:Signal recognition particle receptor FtsY [Chlamydiales bacterium SCGC AG-110-P3]
MALNFFKSGYSHIKSALSKSRSAVGGRVASLFRSGVNDDTIDKLEQVLYEADLGVETAMALTEQMHAVYKANRQITAEGLVAELQNALLETVGKGPFDIAEVQSGTGPTVILIVGVNGNGKTTSVAKLAKRYKDAGKRVLVGAADTFRAAAVDQLAHWAEVIDVDIVKGQSGADPAAVVFDTVTAGKNRGADVIIVDTAGRLQTKTNLMQELEKMRRSCQKVLNGAPHETLLVLDASVGQNAIDQAKTFSGYVPLSGLVLTKLDGSAKGGIAVPIQKQLGVPIKFIGTGEGVSDLEPFNPEQYVKALFAE